MKIRNHDCQKKKKI